MSAVISNPQVTPPGFYRYTVPENKVTVGGYAALIDLEQELKRRYQHVWHLPIPDDLHQRIIEQMCAVLPKGYCNDSDPNAAPQGGALSRAFQRIVNGTSTLWDWYVKENKPKVNAEERETRTKICAQCDFNREPEGCTNCNKGVLANLANRIVGGAFDSRLKACQICGCDLNAKTQLPTDLLLRHMPQWQIQQLPPAKHDGSFSGCWLRKNGESNA